MITVYHNPRCGKSRTACQLMEEKGIAFETVKYLETPLTVEQLRTLIQQLGIRPHELIRTGEEVYKTNYKSKQLSDEQWLQAMAAHPILIERPIVVNHGKAVIARPPEKVWEVVK
jgi:arsenate reductase (glutaredoxin)